MLFGDQVAEILVKDGKAVQLDRPRLGDLLALGVFLAGAQLPSASFSPVRSCSSISSPWVTKDCTFSFRNRSTMSEYWVSVCFLPPSIEKIVAARMTRIST